MTDMIQKSLGEVLEYLADLDTEAEQRACPNAADAARYALCSDKAMQLMVLREMSGTNEQPAAQVAKDWLRENGL